MILYDSFWGATFLKFTLNIPKNDSKAENDVQSPGIVQDSNIPPQVSLHL